MKKRYKNKVDFEVNPQVGGTPAKENSNKIKVIEKKFRLLKNLKSFNDLSLFVLKTNNKLKNAKFIYK